MSYGSINGELDRVALGLGLGLGIPLVLALAYWARQCFCPERRVPCLPFFAQQAPAALAVQLNPNGPGNDL